MHDLRGLTELRRHAVVSAASPDTPRPGPTKSVQSVPSRTRESAHLGLAPLARLNIAGKNSAQASDGETAGPAPSVSRQGANDNNLNKYTEYYIWVPFERRSCRLCIENCVVNFMALILNDEISHVVERHNELELVYRCKKAENVILRSTQHCAMCQSLPPERLH